MMWIKLNDKLYNLSNVFGIEKDSDYSNDGGYDRGWKYYIRFYFIDKTLSNTYVIYDSREDRDEDFNRIIEALDQQTFYQDIDEK